MSELHRMFHTVGFWILIALLIGVVFGGTAVYKFNEWQLNRATLTGAMVIKTGSLTKVYDLKERL